MRKRIDLEYIFSSSVSILFSRLSTAPGLAEWFSDDVKHDGNIFTFGWDGVDEQAELVAMKKNSFVRFKWLDADDEDEFLEFSLHVEPLTEEVALIITDFVDSDEEGDEIELWNKQIEMLHRTVGG
ncbi:MULTISPECIES: START-like domain-containing protein [Butyricimonas]|uniref:START-like domain-containing protein n=1 Tax=Butyricimonas TaxID=574697 RepID=UPI00037A4822|nr:MULTISPECIES: START-like domain-containing protein [Butyricimonas]